MTMLCPFTAASLIRTLVSGRITMHCQAIVHYPAAGLPQCLTDHQSSFEYTEIHKLNEMIIELDS